MELFEVARSKPGEKRDLVPLADRVRPERLEDFAGQEHLLGPGRFLRTLIEKDQLQSLILWGPPGTGKTTLASIIARSTRLMGLVGQLPEDAFQVHVAAPGSQ